MRSAICENENSGIQNKERIILKNFTESFQKTCTSYRRNAKVTKNLNQREFPVMDCSSDDAAIIQVLFIE